MTPIEQRISEGKEAVIVYLEHIDIDSFIAHVEELKKAYIDKGAIKQAIESLQKLLD